MIVDSD